MHPHLSELAQRSDRSTERIREAWHVSTVDQLTWTPDASTWNMVDCLEHLVATERLYQPAVRDAVARARGSDRTPDEPFRFTWFGRWFVTAAGPNPKRKLPAPRLFRPTGGGRDVGVVDQFIDAQRNIASWIDDADGLPLNGRKLTSPVSRLVRLTLGEALTLMVWHTERHVNQALRLREHSGFPTG